jgi:hypothetical protein
MQSRYGWSYYPLDTGATVINCLDSKERKIMLLAFLSALLGVCQAASAGQTTVVEFQGLDPVEVFYVQLDNGKVIQTGIGAQCTPLESQVIIEKPVDLVSPKLAEATANATLFPSVIVYSNGAQFELANARISSYSVSSAVGGVAVERLTLAVEDIGPSPRRP